MFDFFRDKKKQVPVEENVSRDGDGKEDLTEVVPPSLTDRETADSRPSSAAPAEEDSFSRTEAEKIKDDDSSSINGSPENDSAASGSAKSDSVATGSPENDSAASDSAKSGSSPVPESRPDNQADNPANTPPNGSSSPEAEAPSEAGDSESAAKSPKLGWFGRLRRRFSADSAPEGQDQPAEPEERELQDSAVAEDFSSESARPSSESSS
ncbi:MAG: hypothetical protein LBJ64_12335, partial [Deltaproteobacteria bacterium]|nr:hypothetical protein [Deltaproteobacteria bacterium]